MRYSVAAFALQIISLLFSLVALGLASYVFYYDHQWFNIVQLRGHVYFENFVTQILQSIYNGTKDEFPYGGFGTHHRIRINPPNNFAGNFLRHTKSPEIIFLALLVLTNLMQLCALVVTCARRIRFLPQPCRENGCWFVIIGLICTTASIIELISRLEINSFYGSFRGFANSSNQDEKIGAIMLASCGGEWKAEYEAQLAKLSKVSERDDLYVCQRFGFFVAVVVLTFLCALFCFTVALILYCFWTRKTHVDRADAESLDNENQTVTNTNTKISDNPTSVWERPDKNPSTINDPNMHSSDDKNEPKEPKKQQGTKKDKTKSPKNISKDPKNST